jgi:hypothetical protein
MEFSAIDIIERTFRGLGAFFGAYGMKPHVSSVLLALEKVLTAEGASSLLLQVASFNRWYYRCGGRLVVPFRIVKGESLPVPSEARFALAPRGQEVPIASILLRGPARTGQMGFRADVYLRDGEISKIVFNRAPAHPWVFRRNSFQRFEILGIEIILDPANAKALDVVSIGTPGPFSGWLGDLNKKRQITNCSTPLGPGPRTRLLRFFDVDLPNDYVEATLQTEGFTVENCIVFGLSQMDCAVTPSESYYIVASIEGAGYLTFLREAPSGVYFVDNENHLPVKVASGLRTALEMVFEQGVDRWRSV